MAIRYFALLAGQRPSGLLKLEGGVASTLDENGQWRLNPDGYRFVYDDDTIDASEVNEGEAKLIAASLGGRGAI